MTRGKQANDDPKDPHKTLGRAGSFFGELWQTLVGRKDPPNAARSDLDKTIAAPGSATQVHETLPPCCAPDPSDPRTGETHSFEQTPPPAPIDLKLSETIRPRSTGRDSAGREPTPNRSRSGRLRPPSTGRGVYQENLAVDPAFAESTPRTLESVRDELIEIGLATPEQWDQAVDAARGEVGDPLRMVLAHLTRTPSDPERRDMDPVLTTSQAERIYEAPLQYGKFRVVKRLGKGGMGVTYLAQRSDRLRQTVVLKVLRLSDRVAPGETLNRQIEQMISEAAKLISAVEGDRRFFPQFIDFIPDDVEPAIVMEYVHGSTLDAYAVENGRSKLGVEEAFDLFVKIAQAFEIPHNLEPALSHLDVKPSNIMVRPEGDPMILDFGIARFNYGRGAKCGDRNFDSTDMQTKYEDLLGTRVGTPPYMPIEQWVGKPEPRSDVYALGATFYFVLTGQLAFPGRSEPEFFYLHGHADRPHPAAVRPDVPPELDAVVVRMMAIAPEDRCQTMTEVVQALQNARDAWRKRRRRRKQWIASAVAAAAVAPLAIAALAFPDKIFPKPPPPIVHKSKLEKMRDHEKTGDRNGLLQSKEFSPSAVLTEKNVPAVDRAECLVIRWRNIVQVDNPGEKERKPTIDDFRSVDAEIQAVDDEAVRNELKSKTYVPTFYAHYLRDLRTLREGLSLPNERESRLEQAKSFLGAKAVRGEELYLLIDQADDRCAKREYAEADKILNGPRVPKLIAPIDLDGLAEAAPEDLSTFAEILNGRLAALRFRLQRDYGIQIVREQFPRRDEVGAPLLHDAVDRLTAALTNWPDPAPEGPSHAEVHAARGVAFDLLSQREHGALSDEDKNRLSKAGMIVQQDMRGEKVWSLAILMSDGETRINAPRADGAAVWRFAALTDLRMAHSLDPGASFEGRKASDLLPDLYSRCLDELLERREPKSLDHAVALMRDARASLGSNVQFARAGDVAQKLIDRCQSRWIAPLQALLLQDKVVSESDRTSLDRLAADLKTLADPMFAGLSSKPPREALAAAAAVLELAAADGNPHDVREKWADAYQQVRVFQSPDDAPFPDPAWGDAVDWRRFLLVAASYSADHRQWLKTDLNEGERQSAQSLREQFRRFGGEPPATEWAQVADLLDLALAPDSAAREDKLKDLYLKWNDYSSAIKASLTREDVRRELLRTVQANVKESLENSFNPITATPDDWDRVFARLQGAREYAGDDGERSELDRAIRCLLYLRAALALDKAESISDFLAIQDVVFQFPDVLAKEKLKEDAGKEVDVEIHAILKLLACADLGAGDQESALRRWNAASGPNPPKPLPASNWLPDDFLEKLKPEAPGTPRSKMESALQLLAAADSAPERAEELLETLGNLPGDGVKLVRTNAFLERRLLPTLKSVDARERRLHRLFVEKKVDVRDPEILRRNDLAEDFPAQALADVERCVREARDVFEDVPRLLSLNEVAPRRDELLERSASIVGNVASLVDRYVRIAAYVDMECTADVANEMQFTRPVHPEIVKRVQFCVEQLEWLRAIQADREKPLAGALDDDLDSPTSPFKTAAAHCAFLASQSVAAAKSREDLDNLEKWFAFCVGNGQKAAGPPMLAFGGAMIQPQFFVSERNQGLFRAKLEKRKNEP